MIDIKKLRRAFLRADCAATGEEYQDGEEGPVNAQGIDAGIRAVLAEVAAKDTTPDIERECGVGGACVWDGLFCNKCERAYEDRFFDAIAYRETKARVASALENASYGRDVDAVRGARDAVEEWAES